ncbi:MAG: hypothetical protein ACJ780_16950 [Solirubrobacteraceae bacterium]
MADRSRAAHVFHGRHRLLLVVVATAMSCLAVAPASGATTRSPRPARPQVVALLKRAAAELARDDQLVSVVQVLPTPRALRHGAESPNASKLLGTERADRSDRRDDSRLAATLTADERRVIGDAPPGEIAAFNRARHLLGSAIAALKSAGTDLARDVSAIRHPALHQPLASHHFIGSAAATGPPSGPPAVVSLGDSYISGEGGRWAGNNHDGLAYLRMADTGADAYFPPGQTSEQIAGCHRSRSAEIGIFTGQPPGISENLACSGATTSTADGDPFKPGIDFYNHNGHLGQALMLEDYARRHDVRVVMLSIGGNDFKFSSVIKTCLADFLASTIFKRFYCHADSSALNQVALSTVAQRVGDIYRAMQNVGEALSRDGYPRSHWKLVIQLYPAPLPPGADIRYTEFGYERQVRGGCGVWNSDVNWARGTFLATVNRAVLNAGHQVESQLGPGSDNLVYLQTDPTFSHHELCAKNLKQLTQPYTTPGTAKVAEWFTQLRTATTLGSHILSPYEIQEGLHPDHWGQLAMRNCLRHLWNNSGVLTAAAGSYWHCNDMSSTTPTGVDSQGEPLVTLTSGLA